ncbi:MAG: hypothetical protein ACYS0I_14460 [Planctomycetota bacterium]|jgi:hypothetical protein
MKNKELKKKWKAISTMPERVAGEKEAQKKVILTQLGISIEEHNQNEPKLDEKFENYLQTRRATINLWVGILGAIVAMGILVAMLLIAIFKD